MEGIVGIYGLTTMASRPFWMAMNIPQIRTLAIATSGHEGFRSQVESGLRRCSWNWDDVVQKRILAGFSRLAAYGDRRLTSKATEFEEALLDVGDQMDHIFQGVISVQEIEDLAKEALQRNLRVYWEGNRNARENPSIY
ncbi:hypothetical protein HYS91_04840 [Candidatus Daviesbacteria bacterium]|nr:hypothetical protein [Candidatus Daviesbacteria bacterium]